MSLDVTTALAPAIVLKPLPDADATGQEPIRIGGAPQLPAGIDWPRTRGIPLHFYAQIDLKALPSEMSAGAGGYAFPDMPREGTLFIFLLFESDAIYDSTPPKVIHVPQDVRGLPEVLPPEDTLSIEEFYYLENSFDPLSPCGKMLRQQFAEVVPYLSVREEAGLWMHVEREEGDLPKREAMNALQAHSLADALGTPDLLPDPGAAPEGFDAPWLKRLPASFQPDFSLRARRLTWEEIYDWGKDILMEWLSHLNREVTDYRFAKKQSRADLVAPEGENLQEIEAELDASWERLNWTWRDPKWSQAWTPLMLYLWPKSMALDRQLGFLLSVARHAVGPVPPIARKRFYEILHEIDALAQTEQHVPLSTMQEGDWPYTSSVVLRDMAIERLRVLRPRRLSPEPRPEPPSTWDEKVREETMMPYPERNNFSVSGASRVPIQMFGAGYLLQHAAQDHADDVLLLQLAEPFGTGISFMGDALLQLWIRPEDLAAARFDRVETTFEST